MVQSVRWYCVELTSTQLAFNRHEAIRAQFEEVFQMTLEPPDMAMFSSVLMGGVLCLYFSPATASYADTFLKLAHAEPCGRPAERIKLSVGRRDCLGRFRAGEL
ncbi:MAG TPA: hypothetical protein VGF89_05180 [Steroidobacteraceae bacterium]|jgi:hypothetical protein